MNIKDLMTPAPKLISPDTSVKEAAERMLNENVGFLLVGNSDQELMGTLTDRDIVLRAVSKGRDLRDTKVSDILTQDLDYCQTDHSVDEAARHMSERQVRRMPVLDSGKQVVGVVSIGDLAQHLSAQTAGEVLAGVTAEQRV